MAKIKVKDIVLIITTLCETLCTLRLCAERPVFLNTEAQSTRSFTEKCQMLQRKSKKYTH